MVQVTQLEMSIIEQLVHNEFSAEGHGFAGYIFNDENNMNVARGAMASLKKKGIVHDWDTVTANNATWGCLTELVSEPTTDPEWSEYGFRLKNIEVVE